MEKPAGSFLDLSTLNKKKRSKKLKGKLMRFNRIILFTLLLTALNFNGYAQETQEFKVVQDFFAATSAHDYQAIRESVTTDFQLLEIDEIWTMDYLIKLMKKSNKTVKRRNFFKPIKQVKKDKMLWLSYWNKAEFSFKEQPSRAVYWLESVVMVKENNQWLIQMLHSSRVKSEKLPKDIQFKEYINLNFNIE